MFSYTKSLSTALGFMTYFLEFFLEISVPRSPKIQGPGLVNVTPASITELQSLQCVIEGSPTPTVVWSKDGEVREP